MPYSLISALMIVTTVLLSACAQQQDMAAVIDHSTQYFGRDMAAASQYAANYSNSISFNAAPVDSVAVNDPYAPTLVSKQPVAVAANNAAPASSPFGGPTPAPAEPVQAGPQLAANAPAQAAPAATSNWQWPVDGKITAEFGKQREGVSNQGITIAARQDAPIKAAKDGEVAFVGDQVRDYGNMVILRHADGTMSSYSHADRVIVAKGMTVRQGDTIGYVGQTGRAKEPQLHFAIREGDHAIDPLSKLPQQYAAMH